MRHLGDVWRVKSTGRWYFTWGGGGIRKGGHKDGYGAPSEAAEAMLQEILSYYLNRAQGNLNQLNSYRVAASLPALTIALVPGSEERCSYCDGTGRVMEGL